MDTVGYIVFLSGMVMAGYLGFNGSEVIIAIIPIAIIAIGSLLMQTKDGKLFNLYYRESKGLENHWLGIKYLISLFSIAIIFPGGIFAIAIFYVARIFS